MPQSPSPSSLALVKEALEQCREWLPSLAESKHSKIDAALSAVQALGQQAEPVAWLRTGGTGTPVITEEFLRCFPNHRSNFTIPLYASSAALQPPDPALGYATRLAEAIWQKHYQQDVPDWKPLPDLLGVLTQIDNMTSGLARAPAALQQQEAGSLSERQAADLRLAARIIQGKCDSIEAKEAERIARSLKAIASRACAPTEPKAAEGGKAVALCSGNIPAGVCGHCGKPEDSTTCYGKPADEPWPEGWDGRDKEAFQRALGVNAPDGGQP